MEEENTTKSKVSNISIGFSIASLFLAPIPLGIVAFILALIAIGKDESKAVWALVWSILLPVASFIMVLRALGSL